MATATTESLPDSKRFFEAIGFQEYAPPEVAPPVDHETLSRVLDYLEGFGVEFCLYRGYTLKASRLADYIESPPDGFASLFGGTVEEMLRYHGHDIQCRATTRKGPRCRNGVDAADGCCGFPEIPGSFDPESPRWLYCRTHLKTD